MIYFCSQKNRRALVLQSPNLNGIDYLEVAAGADGCGKQLVVTMLKDARALALDPSQVEISGGSSTYQVAAVAVTSGSDAAPRVVTVDLSQSGDFSTYTFSLVANPSTSDPPDGIDPQLATVQFSFKAGCPTVADCQPCNCCPPDNTPEPDINYLAKDYGGFRQAMLDRMATVAPAWNETHAADMGIALVEILAYAADHLSYQQDAAGTEAYLGTARSRISLRRLARLVDYTVNEGSNARTWVYLNTSNDGVVIPAGTLVYPLVPGFPATVRPNTPQAAILQSSPLGFATMQDAQMYVEQNQFQFYTWQDADCCLAPGATSATLIRTLPAGEILTTLQPGSVLIFEEVMGPNTGEPDDANPNNRWAVRLTGVRAIDYLDRPLVDPLNQTPIMQITWASEDALPFPLCISSTTDAAHGSKPLGAVSVASGNILPADHGVWQEPVVPGSVAVTNGSATVTGTGTTFTNAVQTGQWLVFAADTTKTPYWVSTIISDNILTLSMPYTGVDAYSTTAAIMEDLGQVPAPPPAPVTQTSCVCTFEGTAAAPRSRYYPELANSPVTFAYPAALSWTGTVALTNGSATVTATGSATSFATGLAAGQSLVSASDPSATPYPISAIASDASLTLSTPYAGASTASAAASLVNTTAASAFLAPASSGTASATPQIAVYDDQGQQWNVLAESALQQRCAARLRARDRIQRIGLLALWRWPIRHGTGTGRGFSGPLPHRKRDRRQHRARLAHSYPWRTVQGMNQVRNILPAAGGVDPRRWITSANRRRSRFVPSFAPSPKTITARWPSRNPRSARRVARCAGRAVGTQLLSPLIPSLQRAQPGTGGRHRYATEPLSHDGRRPGGGRRGDRGAGH